MKDLGNYECDGQMELLDYLANLDNLRNKYKIPDNEDIKSSSWHYVDEELPEFDDVYFCMSNNCVFRYRAYASGHWWFWASHLNKWIKMWDEAGKVVAWCQLPSKYRATDKYLQEMLGMNGIIKCDTQEEY